MKARFLLSSALSASLALLAGSVRAAGSWEDSLGRFVKTHKLKVVGDTTDLKLSTAPASIGYRDSRVGDGTKQIQLGLKADALSFLPNYEAEKETTALQFGLEYHRDSTHVVKTNREKQNLSVVSFSGDTQPNEGETAVHPFVPIVKYAVEYKNDRVEKGQGITAAVGLSAYMRGARINYAKRTDDCPFFWSPIAELQFENKDGLQTSPPATKPIDGNVTRAKGSVAVTVWPFKGPITKRLELGARYQYWRNLARSGVFASADYPRNQRVVTVSLLAWLDEGEHVGLGFEHSNGENPEKNKPRDRTNEIALKIKF